MSSPISYQPAIDGASPRRTHRSPIAASRRLARRLATTAFLVGVVSFGVVGFGVPGTATAQTDRLSSRHHKALKDLDHRDPRLAKALRRALQSKFSEATKHLEAHARHLDVLAEAKKSRPAIYRLLKRAFAMRREAGKLVTRIRKAVPDARAGLTHELRKVVVRWFDVRHALRTLEVERLADEHQRQMKRLADAIKKPEERAKKWLQRITEGGPAQMRERIAHLSEPDEVGEAEAIGPAILEIAQATSAGDHAELARLSRERPAVFHQRIAELLTKDPELAAQARKQAEPRLAAHRALRAAALHAHRVILPIVPDSGSRRIPEDRRTAVNNALGAVIKAESAAARVDLDRVARQIEANRDLLAARSEARDLIVDLKLASLLGKSARYEW